MKCKLKNYKWTKLPNILLPQQYYNVFTYQYWVIVWKCFNWNNWFAFWFANWFKISLKFKIKIKKETNPNHLSYAILCFYVYNYDRYEMNQQASNIWFVKLWEIKHIIYNDKKKLSAMTYLSLFGQQWLSNTILLHDFSE